MLKFTPEHEWLKLEDGDVATIGISDYAQGQLGDLVFVELPDVGKTLAKGAVAATVESVKAASEVYAPVSGTVTAVNTALGDNAGLVNTEPFAGGWLFKLKVADKAQAAALMDEAAYRKLVG